MHYLVCSQVYKINYTPVIVTASTPICRNFITRYSSRTCTEITLIRECMPFVLLDLLFRRILLSLLYLWQVGACFRSLFKKCNPLFFNNFLLLSTHLLFKALRKSSISSIHTFPIPFLPVEHYSSSFITQFQQCILLRLHPTLIYDLLRYLPLFREHRLLRPEGSMRLSLVNLKRHIGKYLATTMLPVLM